MKFGSYCDYCTRVLELQDQNEKLTAKIQSLENQIRELKLKQAVQDDEKKMLVRQVNMNSSNSSKPPSTDGFRRPKQRSLRENSGLKQGGQPGHAGRNIVLPHNPDKQVEHYPQKCFECPDFQKCKSKSVFICAESRFVIDVVISTEVTEHRIMEPDCAKTECQNSSDRSLKGTFPENIKAYIQYGTSLTSLVSILSGYGFMSYDRITKLVRDLTGLSISTGTAIAMVSRSASKVASGIEDIRKRLLSSKIINTDETGMRINGKLNWVHNTSNSYYTLQTVNEKRGKVGINNHGILSEFKGITIHDCFAPYFSYEFGHGLCCAHLLRELKGIHELAPEHSWAIMFTNLLVSLNRAKNSVLRKGGACFDPNRIERILRRYDFIMDTADRECPKTKKKPKRAIAVERALIKRLRKHKEKVCHFVTDFDVPFDNNQAERDVRYAKVKMKVSGQFRDLTHTQEFLDIASYISTARKNGVSAYTALTAAFEPDFDRMTRL